MKLTKGIVWKKIAGIHRALVASLAAMPLRDFACAGSVVPDERQAAIAQYRPPLDGASPSVSKETMPVMISTGHLGTAPSSPESFHRGIATQPDYLVADGGSSDPGPVYLGDNSQLGLFSREELELFLTASRKRNIPLIIGSAGDSGSNAAVDSFVAMIGEIALQHRIPRFQVGYFYSEVDKSLLKRKLNDGAEIAGLGGFPALNEMEVDRATRVVAVAGIHPFIKLLDMGADVIIGGRCGDINFTAAPCIRAGFPEALVIESKDPHEFFETRFELIDGTAP